MEIENEEKENQSKTETKEQKQNIKLPKNMKTIKYSETIIALTMLISKIK